MPSEYQRATNTLEMAWRRRALASKPNRWLPPEYQRVQYIGFGPYSTSGYAYILIDTSFDEITEAEELLLTPTPRKSMLLTYQRSWGDGMQYVAREQGSVRSIYDVSSKTVGNELYYGCFYTTLPKEWSDIRVRSKRLILRNGSTLVRDLIPCYRKADSNPGMYDMVTKQFFVNQGTGEFVLGPDV